MPPAHLTRERVTQFKLSLLPSPVLPSVPGVNGQEGRFFYTAQIAVHLVKERNHSPALALGRKEGAHAEREGGGWWQTKEGTTCAVRGPSALEGRCDQKCT